jgi:UDP-GlcNAc:undecaprenyl-phosphate GlcNAc-1-phosphate transferase
VLKYALLGVTAAVLALLLTPVVRLMALRLGAFDEPGGRRIHQGRIPRLGGVALLAALIGTIALERLADYLLGTFHGYSWRWDFVLAGALIVAATGAADDLWSVGPFTKVAFQILGGLLALAAGYGITSVTNPLTGTTIQLGWLAWPLTLLWVIGITNAFNLIDGLDGLAAGVALIASGTLLVASLAAERIDVALLCVVLAGALAGFLYYNFSPASIFLGDSGSLLLGYLLAVLSIQSAHKGATTVVILVPILALGLPIMDTLLAILRRVLRALRVVRLDHERNEYRFLVIGSASVFNADRDHIHHRLLALGLTHRRAVLVLYGVCVALSCLALLAVQASGGYTAALVTVVGVATFVGVRKLGYHEVEVLRHGMLLPLFELPVLNRRLLHALVDAGFVVAAYSVSFFVVHGGSLERTVRAYLLLSVAVVAAVKLGVFIYSGVYQRTYRYTNAGDLLALVKAVAAAQLAAIAVLAVVYGLPSHAVALLALDGYVTATLVIGARASFKLLEVMAHGLAEVQGRPALIYGAGAGGTALLREIGQNPALGIRAVGFADDLTTLWGRQINGVPVLGGSDHLGAIIRRHGIRDVIVASPKIAPERLETAAAACRMYGAQLRHFRMTLESVHSAAPPRAPALLRPAILSGVHNPATGTVPPPLPKPSVPTVIS